MDTVDLARRIQLHPRAVVMIGKIEPRLKNKKTLPGLTPHYARAGCPIVQWTGANAIEEPSSAEIEFLFPETGFPLPSAVLGKQSNLIQMYFGRLGQAPSQAAYRVLREAGTIITQFLKRDALLVTLPLLIPGPMGTTTGKHFLLAVFDLAGVPLYVNPAAIENGALKAEWPPHQKERSTAGVAGEATATAAGGTSGWYATMAAALRAVITDPKQLHDAILRGRAQQLVEQGAAPNLDAGLAQARNEAPKPSPAAEKASKPTSGQRGARLRGRVRG